METFFVGAVIAVGAAFVLVTVALLQTVKRLTGTIRELHVRVDDLGKRLIEQDEQIRHLRTVLEEKEKDPVSIAVQAFQNWRVKGLVPALTMLAVQRFRAYLKGRSTKALPSRQGAKVEP